VTRGEPIYWLGKVGNCDICGTDLNALPSFADCVIDRRSWMWGLVCTFCLESIGMQLKPGYGQLYARQSNKLYVCRYGQPPPALFFHKEQNF
jgi:hypothetical protein